MLTVAERRALMANTGALPPMFAAEIFDPASVMDLSSLHRTNSLQKQGQKRIWSVDNRASYSSSDYGGMSFVLDSWVGDLMDTH